jgi:hypothetical protein
MCDREGNLSREHVFPNWLNTVFGKTKEPYQVAWRADRADGTRQHRTHQTGRIDQTVFTVCRVCNNGWMARLEGEAKPLLVPLITDEAGLRRLTPQDQLTVAAWASLKVAVAEDLGGDRVITQAQRQALRLTQSPPASGRVHLARYSGDIGPVRYVRYSGRAPVGHEFAGAAAATAALIIGRLVILVLLSPDNSHQTAKAQGESRANWISICPPSLPTAPWPPAESVDEEGVTELLRQVAPGMVMEHDLLTADTQEGPREA